MRQVQAIPKANNVIAVRLMLACMVIYTHCVWRVTSVTTDLLAKIFGRPGSSIAVDGFFFLSGLLVYGSLLHHKHARNFLFARVARLWPALAVMVGIVATIGAFISTADFITYSKSAASFVFGNLIPLRGAYYLAGIDMHGSLVNVNASIWTIAWEIKFYLLLFIFRICHIHQPKRVISLTLIPTAILIATMQAPAILHKMQTAGGAELIFPITIILRNIDRLWTMFILGMGAFIFWPKIKLSWYYCAILTTFWGVIAHQHFFFIPHFDSIAIGYLVLCTCFHTGTLSAHWPDYSYGIYIYAYPVMMILSAVVQFQSPSVLAICTFLVTIPIAALSWHVVEQPILRFAKLKSVMP